MTKLSCNCMTWCQPPLRVPGRSRWRLAILPRLGLYRPLTVLSGSMRPTFDPGDLVGLVARILAGQRPASENGSSEPTRQA